MLCWAVRQPTRCSMVAWPHLSSLVYSLYLGFLDAYTIMEALLSQASAVLFIHTCYLPIVVRMCCPLVLAMVLLAHKARIGALKVRQSRIILQSSMHQYFRSDIMVQHSYVYEQLWQGVKCFMIVKDFTAPSCRHKNISCPFIA